jgi:hypothetical protein
MKTEIKYLLVLGLASFVFVGCATNHCGNCKMTQMEYKIEKLGGLNLEAQETELNKVGKDGWKLVTVDDDTYVFERLKR